MLVKPPLEKLLPHVENRYTLAVAIAKRTRQLVLGAQPMAESESPNLVTLACEELAAGEIEIVPDIVTPFINLRPEVVAMQNEREQEDNRTSVFSPHSNTEDRPIVRRIVKNDIDIKNELDTNQGDF